jgi:hypothetical protein
MTEEVRHTVPYGELRNERRKRQQAEKRIAELEQRVSNLEAALKANRQEWVFRRPRDSDRSRMAKTEGLGAKHESAAIAQQSL